jgi:hypothetical protein
MQQLTKDTIVAVDTDRSNLVATVVFQYEHNGTNMSLYGSLTGTNFVHIETFSATTLKEITWVPYLALSSLTNATRTGAEITANTSANNGIAYIDHA